MKMVEVAVGTKICCDRVCHENTRLERRVLLCLEVVQVLGKSEASLCSCA